MDNIYLDNESYLKKSIENKFLDSYIINICSDENSLLQINQEDCDFIKSNWENIKDFNSVSSWSENKYLIPSWFLLLSHEELAYKLIESKIFPELFKTTKEKYHQHIDASHFLKTSPLNVINDESLLNVLNMPWMFRDDVKIFDRILDRQDMFSPKEFVCDYIYKKHMILTNQFVKDLLFESKYRPNVKELIEIDQNLLNMKKGMISSIVHGAAVNNDIESVLNAVDLVNDLCNIGLKDVIFDLMKPNQKSNLSYYVNTNDNIFTQIYKKKNFFTQLNDSMDVKQDRSKMKI